MIDYARIDSPALIIDKTKVAYNIELAIQYAGGVDRLRPHVKTHKLLEVAAMQRAAGIYKFKCATIAEAEMLGMIGAPDVLLAYPIQGPKVNRFLQLMEKFPNTTYSALLDNYSSATWINTVASSVGRKVRLYIDVNVGQFRTGIQSKHVLELVEACQNFSSLELVGLHAYDGHLHMPSLTERKRVCEAAFAEVFVLRHTLEATYGNRWPIIAGGSPTFRIHAAHHNVECSPGTFIFWDQGYAEKYPEQSFAIAAKLLTRVISRPDAHTYCFDIGHKSVASEMPFPRVHLETRNPLRQVGHSEEHLIVKSEVPDVLEEGEHLLATPYHICPTVALYEKAIIIEEEKVIGEWEIIARKRKITI